MRDLRRAARSPLAGASVGGGTDGGRGTSGRGALRSRARMRSRGVSLIGNPLLLQSAVQALGGKLGFFPETHPAFQRPHRRK